MHALVLQAHWLTIIESLQWANGVDLPTLLPGSVGLGQVIVELQNVLGHITVCPVVPYLALVARHIANVSPRFQLVLKLLGSIPQFSCSLVFRGKRSRSSCTLDLSFVFRWFWRQIIVWWQLQRVRIFSAGEGFCRDEHSQQANNQDSSHDVAEKSLKGRSLLMNHLTLCTEKRLKKSFLKGQLCQTVCWT